MRTTLPVLNATALGHYSKLDAIFYGEVVATNKPTNTSGEIIDGPEILKVKVIRAWKGMEAAEISVVYGGAYETFEKEVGPVGTKSIFYAWKQISDPNLHVGFCSFFAYNDEKTKRLLGDGKLIEQPARSHHPLRHPKLKTISYRAYGKELFFFQLAEVIK